MTVEKDKDIYTVKLNKDELINALVFMMNFRCFCMKYVADVMAKL